MTQPSAGNEKQTPGLPSDKLHPLALDPLTRERPGSERTTCANLKTKYRLKRTRAPIRVFLTVDELPRCAVHHAARQTRRGSMSSPVDRQQSTQLSKNIGIVFPEERTNDHINSWNQPNSRNRPHVPWIFNRFWKQFKESNDKQDRRCAKQDKITQESDGLRRQLASHATYGNLQLMRSAARRASARHPAPQAPAAVRTGHIMTSQVGSQNFFISHPDRIVRGILL